MIIGIPKEMKKSEFRVGLDPEGVKVLTTKGFKVLVQKGVGEEIGFSKDDYIKSGAEIISSIEELYSKADMIIKVKEPQEQEIDLLREGQLFFCYFHLAADRKLTEKLIEKGIIAVAFETITDDKNKLPLLVPMSEIAGRVSVQAGATALQMENGGRGVLLSGAPGVNKANVIVIGGGVAGEEAVRISLAMGADVTVLDTNIARLKELSNIFGIALKTRYSTYLSLKEELLNADLVIGAVLIPGAKAPVLISKDTLKKMKRGSVIVDIAIDQGGCSEASHPTTHIKPTFVYEGVIHYCVTNIPSVCARTSTQALSNAILPYCIKLANNYKRVMLEEKNIRNGLNLYFGKVTNKAVADSLDFEYFSAKDLLLEKELSLK